MKTVAKNNRCKIQSSLFVNEANATQEGNLCPGVQAISDKNVTDQENKDSVSCHHPMLTL